MYCGREGFGNPSDYGLHFNDEDVFGEKYVCPLCDEMITQSNRMFKKVLEKLQKQQQIFCKSYIRYGYITITENKRFYIIYS